MRKARLVIIFYLLLLIAPNAFSQNQFKLPYEQIFFKGLLSANLAANDSLLLTLPEDAGKGLLISYQAMIKAVLKPSPIVLEQLIEQESEAMSMMEDSDHLLKEWMEAEALWHWTIVHYLAGNEWSAFFRFRDAYLSMRKVNHQYPDFIPAKKSMAAFKIILGIVPEQYEWALKLLSMEPDAEKGVEVLTSIIGEKSLYGLEASIIMALLKTYLYKEPSEGLSYYYSIEPQYLRLAGIQYLGSMLHQKNNEVSKAIALIHTINLQEEWLSPWVYWQKGNLLLYSAQFKEAGILFRSFTNTFEGEHFTKDGYYKRFICSWLDTTTTTNYHLLDSVQAIGVAQTAADKYALAFASQPLPDSDLMYIRMLFDGGSFSQAEEYWKGLDLTDFGQKDSVEWAYRGGRLAQGLNNHLEAVKRLQWAVSWQPIEEAWYFAPNACLQLGHIYKETRDIEQSQKYFTKVFVYQNFPYETAIKQEAKSEITKISQD